MTKTETANKIYAKEHIKPSRRVRRKLGKLPSDAGYLCGMGRHLHTLGHCVLVPAGYVTASHELRAKVKHKVTEHATNREKYQSAIGIDLMLLYEHYSSMPKQKIAGINELGTVIVFVDVPPSCLIWGIDGPIDAGTFWKG
jgi:hypothetical protein